MRIVYLLIIFVYSQAGFAQENGQLQLAKVKYNGGGDWYANKTALPNLAQYANSKLGTNLSTSDAVVEIGSPDIYQYAFLYLTGHGNISFSENEATNLRQYLISGGFLHIDDNYGLDQFIRLEMKKVFPELEFIELPFNHPIYRQPYTFSKGLPKIHEHDGKPAQGFGLIYQGKLVCYYSYESDLGNGWEDRSVHNDPEEKRQEALQMGTNLIYYIFTQN